MNPQQYCEACGGMHESIGVLCDNPECGLCFRLCVRQAACSWKDETIDYQAQKLADDRLTKQMNAPNVTQIVENFALASLREAFECWMASTDRIKQDCDPATLWVEFEQFAKEVLTPVDSGKQYLVVTKDEAGKPEIDFLDSNKLFVNQDKEYVIVEGKRRKRIGKNVAVMG